MWVLQELKTGKLIYINKPRMFIGSGPSADIIINSTIIAPTHACLVNVNKKIRIFDEGTYSGIYVRAMRIYNHELAHGDVITIAKSYYDYQECNGFAVYDGNWTDFVDLTETESKDSAHSSSSESSCSLSFWNSAKVSMSDVSE